MELSDNETNCRMTKCFFHCHCPTNFRALQLFVSGINSGIAWPKSTFWPSSLQVTVCHATALIYSLKCQQLTV